MKKITIGTLLFCIISVGCKDKSTVVVTQPSKLITKSPPANTKTVASMSNDLVIMVGILAHNRDCAIKYEHYKGEYYRTGNDKYRRLGNKYLDSTNYWYDSLQTFKTKP